MISIRNILQIIASCYFMYKKKYIFIEKTLLNDSVNAIIISFTRTEKMSKMQFHNDSLDFVRSWSILFLPNLRPNYSLLTSSLDFLNLYRSPLWEHCGLCFHYCISVGDKFLWNRWLVNRADLFETRKRNIEHLKKKTKSIKWVLVKARQSQA